MNKYSATVEFLSGQSAAILTLTDHAGEWAGSGRVEGRDRSTIYERAYTLASLSAQSKGGRLERLSVVDSDPNNTPGVRKAMRRFRRKLAEVRRETCGASVTPAFQRRPGNALNIEPIQPWARCLDKKPATWTEGSSAIRWMASGGEAWVFGPCNANCPRRPK